MMQEPDLQTSIDYALLEYQHQLNLRTPEQMSGAGFFRMSGALEFINELKNLAESTPRAVPQDRDNLNHQA